MELDEVAMQETFLDDATSYQTFNAAGAPMLSASSNARDLRHGARSDSSKANYQGEWSEVTTQI